MRLRLVLTAGIVACSVAARAHASECNPNDPSLLKPDLVAQPPTKLRVVQHFGHRLLMFTTTIGNVGDGPLIVHTQTSGSVTAAIQEIQRANGTSCTHAAGFFAFDSAQKQFQFEHFTDYQLRSGDPFTGPIVAEAGAAYCLLDVSQLRGFTGSRQLQADCSEPNGTQGISVGFADVYDNFLPDQTIDLDADPTNPVPPGIYFLVNLANPDGLLLENGSLQTNASVVSVAIPGLAGQHVPVSHHPVPVSTHPGPPTRTPSVTPTRTATPLPTTTPTPGGRARPPHRTLPPGGSGGAHPSHPPHVLPPGHEGCAGIGNALCSPGEFCEFSENTCNIQGLTGICTPLVNPDCYPPKPGLVCGCDGATYADDCARRRAGVSAAHHGPC